MSTPRVAILAGLFVAGGLAGAGGTSLLVANEGAADLIAGEQIWRTELGPNGGLTITIDVYNPEDRVVSVEPLAIGGWDVIAGPSDPVDAAAREWTAVSFEVIPGCEGNGASTFDVVADDVPSELELTDDATGTFLGSLRQTYCGGAGIELEPVVESRRWAGDTYVLDVRLPGHGRAGIGDLTIDAVSAGVPYAVEAEGLPAMLPVDGSVTLTTRWTFDCDPGPDVLADPVGPGGEQPYEAMYLTAGDDIQIHADVSALLTTARGRACSDAQ